MSDAGRRRRRRALHRVVGCRLRSRACWPSPGTPGLTKPLPLSPPCLPATDKHVVEQDTTYGLSIDRDTLWDSVNFAVLKTRSWKECQDKCLAQKYCQVFLAGPTAT